MNKKQIKEVFKNYKVQLGAGAWEVVEDELNRYERIMAVNGNNGKLKRHNPDNKWVAIGRHEW